VFEQDFVKHDNSPGRASPSKETQPAEGRVSEACGV
jgi:hypothetical protein